LPGQGEGGTTGKKNRKEEKKNQAVTGTGYIRHKYGFQQGGYIRGWRLAERWPGGDSKNLNKIKGKTEITADIMVELGKTNEMEMKTAEFLGGRTCRPVSRGEEIRATSCGLTPKQDCGREGYCKGYMSSGRTLYKQKGKSGFKEVTGGEKVANRDSQSRQRIRSFSIENE